jgi:hypothetical protein
MVIKNFQSGFNFSTPVDLCISYSIPTSRSGTQASYSSLFHSLPTYPTLPCCPPTSPNPPAPVIRLAADARGGPRSPACSAVAQSSPLRQPWLWVVEHQRRAESGTRSEDLASVGAHRDWNGGVSLGRFLTTDARRGGPRLGVSLGGFLNRAPTSSMGCGSAPAVNSWRGAAASADTAMKGRRSLRDPCSLPGPPLVRTQASHAVDSVGGGVRGQSGDNIELTRWSGALLGGGLDSGPLFGGEGSSSGALGVRRPACRKPFLGRRRSDVTSSRRGAPLSLSALAASLHDVLRRPPSSPRWVVGMARERVDLPPRPCIQAERDDAGFGVAETKRNHPVAFAVPWCNPKIRERRPGGRFGSPFQASVRTVLESVREDCCEGSEWSNVWSIPCAAVARVWTLQLCSAPCEDRCPTLRSGRYKREGKRSPTCEWERCNDYRMEIALQKH